MVLELKALESNFNDDYLQNTENTTSLCITPSAI